MNLLGPLLDVLVVTALSLEVGKRCRELILGWLAWQGKRLEGLDECHERPGSLIRSNVSSHAQRAQRPRSR